MNKNTIYALSTSFAKSAIAIVRVSGDSALYSLKKLTKKENFIPSKATLCNIYDSNDDILDNSMVIYFKNPNSYTGQDLVEYYLHGSLAVIKEMLEILSSFDNHRLAEAGEFTKIALENNKISLISAEGILDLINAETYQQRKQAVRELKGEVDSKYELWYEDLKNILALVEATIDFSDQDIPEDTFAIAFAKLDELKSKMEKEIISGNKIKKLKDGIKIAIIGSPNTGKSSLINYLSKRDVAIVSNIAGTTRDVIEVFLDIAGFPVVIADTAGIRETNETIEQEGIKRALKVAIDADIKIVLIDATSIEDQLKDIKEYLSDDSFVVINKIDLINQEKLEKIKNYLDKEKVGKNLYFISIKEKVALEVIEKKLEEKLVEIAGIKENPIVLHQRHNDILQECIKSITLGLERKDDIVILSFYLRQALNEMGKILGKTDIEEILGKIFSSFCIGK